MELSKKVQEMQFSPIRKFNSIAQKEKDAGKIIYHLNIGQPDVATPDVFFRAINNFDSKVVAYAESGGLADLQDAICEYLANYDVKYDRDNIIVTSGGSEALSMIFTAILDEGDEVLVPEPYYTNYTTFLSSAGGNLVPITTTAEEGYHFAQRDKIEATITPRTKAICCNSPGNPTGRVLTYEEMVLIGQVAKEHDLWIISDEVYREFAYDGREATSFGQVKEVEDRLIIVDSVSKRYSACGARIGFFASKNAEFMNNAMKIAQGRLSVSTIDQIGATELFKLPASYYKEIISEYCGRRDVAYEELMKIPGVICQKPGGAFYMTAKLPVDNVESFLMFLLEEFEDNGESVMFAPAEGFYATPGLGKDEMRIAYVLNKEAMRRAVELIRLGIEAYNSK